MSVFLRFLFNEENLKMWLRPEWLKHYEPGFVDDQLVAKARARAALLFRRPVKAGVTRRQALALWDRLVLSVPRQSLFPAGLARCLSRLPAAEALHNPNHTGRLPPCAQALVFVPQVELLVNALEGAIAEAAAKREAEAEAVRLLAEGKGGKGEHTVPEPFELSQPKFRTVPVPEEAIDVGFTGEKDVPQQHVVGRHVVRTTKLLRH
jgi:hypothetical protein